MIFKGIKKMTKFLKNEKGASIIEFAFVAILVIGLLFAIVDLGMMFYVNLTMQHAVREGARYAIIGPTAPLGDTRTRRALVIDKIHDSSVGLCDRGRCPDSNIHFYVLESGTAVPIDPDDPVVGAPSQIIEVMVDYSWPLMTPLMKLFFPNGKYNFRVGATMRNEPFPASGG
jgi:Flp pilus assembly pilin Flp